MRLAMWLLCFNFIGFNSFAEPTSDAPSNSGIYIKVGEAELKRSLMAMPPFQYLGTPSATNQNLGGDLFNVVLNDLTVSDYFSFIRQDAFLENPVSSSLTPGENGFKFDSWKQIGAEFLVRAGYQVVRGEITLEAYVYYVPQGKLIFGKKYHSPATAARKLSHTFANDIVEKLSGKRSFFLSKFVTVIRRAGQSNKDVSIMDWDGNNPHQVSEHKTIVLSPAWAPDGKSIAYTAFVLHPATKLRNADLFRYDLETGRRWLISFRKGLNSGVSFIPNTQNILATLSKDGNPDIYEMTREGEIVRQITHGPGNAMNVEAAASPDGKEIAFSSDRGGNPMVYVMNRDGSNAKARTFVGKYNASPAWSPDGKKIAFAGQDHDHFDIFVMNADGSQMVRLTNAKRKNGKWSNNEDPSFSPDGTRVVYVSDRTGNNQIYISNLDGTNERQITFDKNDYFKPRWSPYLD